MQDWLWQNHPMFARPYQMAHYSRLSDSPFVHTVAMIAAIY
jgi:hypothetical protein